jgi:hypothetical protein
VELEHGLAIEDSDGAGDLDTDNIVGCDMLISWCEGLIAEDKESGIIRLMHYTTQTYLERNLAHITGTLASGLSSAIAVKCIHYLTFRAFANRPCATDEQYEKRLKSYPLVDYAAKYWGTHVRQSEEQIRDREDNNRVTAAAALLLDSPGLVQSAAQVMSNNKWWRGGWTSTCGSHLLARLGLAGTFLSRMKTAIDLDSRDGDGRSPLSRAATNGNTAIVEMLLKQEGVDANSRDTEYGRSPLPWAAANDHIATFEQLVARKGIDSNALDNQQWSALH